MGSGFLETSDFHPALVSLYGSPDHFGERPCKGVKGELLEEGETPSILAGDPEEEPTLLRLPSSRSDERLRRERMSATQHQTRSGFFLCQ